MDRALAALPSLLAIVALGAVLCLPLVGWDIRAFLRSSLFIKICMWVPLYGFLLLVADGGMLAGVAAATLLALLALIEWNAYDTGRRAWWYVLLFTVLCVAWPVSTARLAPDIWLTYCLISVFSDVLAYFFGNYGGKHKLPKWINPRKSYEGVAGQLVGGVAGSVVFSMILGTDVAWWTGLLIGVASALGDLANSVAKRQADIKDWGNTIPGHGGVMDRFASLGMVLVAVAMGIM